MSDDIKLNGQCIHGHPADGTCPYCCPAEKIPVKHDDDIKKAAHRVIEACKKYGCYADDPAYMVARAYLAIREQVETVALPALECTSSYLAKTKASAGDIAPLHEDMQSMVDAAIKAIEEGQG